MEPRSEAELAEAVAGAAGPLRVVGGGTRPIGAPVAGDPLPVAGLAGVSLYEPGALTLVAAAGTPLAEVEQTLAVEGQRLGFEPMDHRPLLGRAGVPTIGGVAAANVSGPRRIQAGACRDSLLGVRFVDGRGAVLKNGGRVMKNVTGYDLVKLMAGAFGTLGVLTEVAFKVQAIPETEATLVATGLDAGEAVDRLSAALGSPYDITGAAHLGPGCGAPEARTVVRIEGLADSVRYRAGALKSALGGDWQVIGDEASAALWREVRDVAPFAAGDAPVWRVSVKPSDGPVLVAVLEQAGLAKRAILDWGGGLVWVEVDDDPGDGGAAAIRDELARLGGHATLVRGSDALRARVPVFQPEPAPLAAISAGLRAKFDPRGILNPGLMGRC
ncbi:FAD-binding protein [Pukyongiella litopenaei]|uniref:FAD-binding protein n=1 Tax=Pukyongiella litopenaei TaxID=2605946 RepID=A0A2S0MPQ7_9RHOB|nr:FAD-binding protein [Pukyongiella litopenaei]AVO37826.1 FAD-binding protein [Pukyongiella litopenaei]